MDSYKVFEKITSNFQTIFMIYLKEHFVKGGVEFTQCFKDSELVIFQLSQPSIDDPSEITKWYEVFQLKVKQKDIYHPDEFEKYPNDEAFGVWAWCCSNEKCVVKVLKKHFPKHSIPKWLLELHN